MRNGQRPSNPQVAIEDIDDEDAPALRLDQSARQSSATPAGKGKNKTKNKIETN